MVRPCPPSVLLLPTVRISFPKSITVLHTAFESQEIKARAAGDQVAAGAWAAHKQALEDAICLATTVHETNGDFARAFQRYQDIRIVRTARVQISSLMMDRINHAKGLERKVRNSLFEGRTPEQFYDRLAWLYTPPPYVK